MIRVLLAWLGRREQLLVLVLGLVVVGTAVAVNLSIHQTRQHYARLQELSLETDMLDSTWEKLLLEGSAWADYSRVDTLARTELGMVPPAPASVVLVAPARAVLPEPGHD